MNRKKTTYLIILSLLFVIFLAVTGKYFPGLGDGFYRLNILYGKNEKCDSVVIVGIDSLSIEKMGKFPWPRSRFAHLTEKISSYNPRVIALNFFFPEKSGQKENDSLSAVFGRIDNLVLPFKAGNISKKPPASMAAVPKDLIKQSYRKLVKDTPFSAPDLYTSVQLYRPMKEIYLTADNSGFLNISTLRSSGRLKELIHVIQVGNSFYPSIGVAALKSFYGTDSEKFTLSEDGRINFGKKSVKLSSYAGSLLLNFRVGEDSILTVSAADVFSGKVDSSVLRNKLVFVGMTDPYSSPDLFDTPAGEKFPGVEVWATSAADMITEIWITRGNRITDIIYWAAVLLIFPGAVLLSFFNMRRRLILLTTAVITVASMVFSFIFFNHLQYFWNPEYHIYAWIFSAAWIVFERFISGPQKSVS